jgi:dienelactone hydrolase
MGRLAAFAGLLLALWATGTLAQDATPKPPLDIRDETIGLLRKKQAGSLILPRTPRPFPAVIVLHGCNGVSQNTRQWARRLADWGYAALILDSFTSRGIDNVCEHGLAFSGAERARDAFAAAAWLRERSDIDRERIGLLGYSHGGWTALAAARANLAKKSGTAPFAAIVAYYPNCPPVAPPLVTDVQILAGEADDWAPAERCTDMVARYADAAAHRPWWKIYPGATHSFDADRPERLYFGHKLAYDAAAAADSFAVARTFLDHRLKR